MTDRSDYVGKLAVAARELIEIGLTPAQVAYVFREVVSSVVAEGDCAKFESLENAVGDRVTALGNGFSISGDVGYCYLKLIKVAKRIDVARELQKDPTVSRFLTVDKSDLDTVAMRKHTIVKVAGGYHVREALNGEVTAMDSITATIKSMGPIATTLYLSYNKHKVSAEPLNIGAKIGGGDSSDCLMDKSRCLRELTRTEGKVLAIANPDEVEGYLQDVHELALVCPKSLKPYFSMIYKSATVITPEELRVSNDAWDVVVLTNGVATDLTAMKARIKMAFRFARHLVCYTVFGSPALSGDILSFIASLPAVKSPGYCVCKVKYRLPAFDIDEHTVLGGCLLDKYTSLERIAECSSGALGKVALLRVVPFATDVAQIIVGGGVQLCMEGPVYIERADEKHSAVVLSVGDVVDYTTSIKQVVATSFETTLYVNALEPNSMAFIEEFTNMLARHRTHAAVIDEGWQSKLVETFSGLQSNGHSVELFVTRARKTLTYVNAPFYDPSLGDVNYILEATGKQASRTIIKIKKVSKKGALHTVDVGKGQAFVIGGKYRFVVLVPDASVAVSIGGNWFYTKAENPFVVQRNGVFEIKALRKDVNIFIMGLTYGDWIKTSGNRLLGQHAGCWASGGWLDRGYDSMGTPVYGDNGCKLYNVVVEPGSKYFVPDITGSCVLERKEGTSSIGVHGAIMTADSGVLCITNGCGKIENFGESAVKLKITTIYNEIKFNEGDFPDSQFDDAVIENV